jgi:hypothetical protein
VKRKFTAVERKLMRQQEAEILRNIDKLPPERRVLAEIAAKNRRYQDAKKAGKPEVGIFWTTAGGKLLMDGTPITEAESYGNLKIYDGTHTKLWDTYQRAGIVPADIEYDEYPRGRVAYDTKKRQYYLFADACILKNKTAVTMIMNEFNLPWSNTVADKDPHYKCPACKPKRTKKQEEKDWEGV